MNPLPEDMENALTGSQSSHASLRDVHSINPTHLMARIESYEGREKKGISDVRRTFCLFVTFDLLFVTLLWIIELNVNGGIENTLEKEVVQYDFYSSYFDIFLLAVFRFKVLILAYAVCRLRHWWAIALTTSVTSAFLLAKVILSKVWPPLFLNNSVYKERKPRFPGGAMVTVFSSPAHICYSSFSLKGLLATCCPSFHSSSPGLRRGSWISKCYLKRQRKKTVSRCQS
ncbi:STARD3 N-terminal like [Rhinolophus ferrumequinum]|uniref:STARD3 N-terminal like n=1 Tax=Rhinolophus ferrumequinum TaxID=59479 RepID=A0A7J7TP11_RHIFE|nr:STARD3 N-terminal like [Rhinolophus ferrumequinum]